MNIWKMRVSALLFALALLSVGIAHAQPEDEVDLDIEDIDASATYEDMPADNAVHVFVSGVMPEYSEGEVIPVDQSVSVVLGFHNANPYAVNLTSIGGALAYPDSPSTFVRNFTRRELGIEVAPGMRQSVEYKFIVESTLESLELVFVSDVEYSTYEGFAIETFFQSTLKFGAFTAAYDIAELLSYVLFGSVMFAVFYILNSVFNVETAQQKKKKKAAAPIEGTRTAATDIDDYIIGKKSKMQ